MEFYEIDHKVPKGKLIRIRAWILGGRINQIKINGDFFIHPEEKMNELESLLKGVRLEKSEIEGVVCSVLSECELIGVTLEDVINTILEFRNR